ncbi:MAG: PD-(D/E)XK nuclease family protein [bacterium]
MQSGLNRQLTELAEVFKRNRTGEKWIMSPSLRTGFQWLDRLSWQGAPVLNARVKTFAGLALELASPEMERRGLSYVSGLGSELLMDRVLARLQGPGEGYVFGLARTPGLVRTALRGVSDLRLSGVSADTLRESDFEVGAKGREIKELLVAFEKELDKRSLLDYAGVLALAVSLLGESHGRFTEEVEIIIPSDLHEGLSYMERELWKSFPEKSRSAVGVDQPGAARSGPVSDSGLLGWINDPANAPAPNEDGSASLFRAVGEVNEVREVLRRLVENSIPFDQVEIIHTDSETYVPLLYELSCLLSPLGEGYLPATFQEGIPSRYSRPARALQGFISWMRDGYPQSTLVRMIEDGLLNLTWEEGEPLVYSSLAALFRRVPVGGGADRYLPLLEREIKLLSERGVSRSRDDEEGPGREARTRKARELESLRELAGSLLELAGPEEGPEAFLQSAAAFLGTHARSVNQLDEYSRRLLLRNVEELQDHLEEGLPGRDLLEWLEELSRGGMVGGLGPRPGCLYISPLSGGGHSGRPYTYIIGLDESRFPGVGFQDPLLLDKERNAVSERLPTSSGRTELKTQGFARLLARLRGRVTLSYSCRDLEDDRDMFPSTAMLSAFRILSGLKEGVLDELYRWLPPPVSFAPEDEKTCIDYNEWWIRRMCGDTGIKDPEIILAKHFPHLGRGFKARAARESNRFTEYDGYVPRAGEDIDPARKEGMVLSSSKLEKMGRWPLDFFFKYVLRIEPPEEYVMDPEVWLDHLERGSLLHEVFRRFMSELQRDSELPGAERHMDRLMEIVREEAEKTAELKPPPGPDVFERERNNLLQCARIFLLEEEIYCASARPVFFEACIGLPSDKESTELDTSHPVPLRLPDGRSVRAWGRLDRVDELVEEGRNKFAVWDYKTGSKNRYSLEDPFQGGRVVQNALYLDLARSRLSELYPGASVVRFGYFFPGTALHGERISWSDRELEGGREVIQELCELMAAGCFPVSDIKDDYKFCDYREAVSEEEKSFINSKLSNPENEMLRPFRKLRGLEDKDE